MINVLIDSQEKRPWLFNRFDFIDDTTIQHLSTGDYTARHIQDKLCIERKGSVAEIAQNINQKCFKNELERMVEFDYSFLICEFDYNHIFDFPHRSNLPFRVKKKIRVNSGYIIKSLSEIQLKYKINILLCSNVIHAEYVAADIIKRVSRLYE